MESGIKQTNLRVKGSEKQWLLPNAEAMLALRCLALSEDGRWGDHFDMLRRWDIGSPAAGVRRRQPPVARPPGKLRRTG